MKDIRQKSIGFLIDEYITACFKYDAKPTEEIKMRRDLLRDTIMNILGNKLQTDIEFYGLYMSLYSVLRRCWESQEIVVRSDKRDIVFFAAKEAQTTNAERNKLIREIDQLLGEGDITSLEKTYG